MHFIVTLPPCTHTFPSHHPLHRAWKYIKSRDGAWAPRGERGESSGGGGAGALTPGPTLTAGTVPQPRRPGAGSSSQARSRLGGARSSGGNTAGGSAMQASRERRAAAAADTAASPDAGRQRLKRPRPGPTPRGTRFQDAPPSDSEGGGGQGLGGRSADWAQRAQRLHWKASPARLLAEEHWP